MSFRIWNDKSGFQIVQVERKARENFYNQQTSIRIRIFWGKDTCEFSPWSFWVLRTKSASSPQLSFLHLNFQQTFIILQKLWFAGFGGCSAWLPYVSILAKSWSMDLKKIEIMCTTRDPAESEDLHQLCTSQSIYYAPCLILSADLNVTGSILRQSMSFSILDSDI